MAFYQGIDAQGRLVPVNLTGATPSFFLIDENWSVLGSVQGSVLDPTAGLCLFTLPANLTANLGPGNYLGQFKIVWSSDEQNPMRLNGSVRLIGGVTA